MQIIINIDDGLIARLKKNITRKRAALALTIFVILASALLFAATKPHTFTPGSTISSSQVNENFDAAFEAVAKAVPVGTIIAYGGTSAPEGWLLCDRNSYSRAEYPELFNIIGTAFGSANSSSFNVPDLRGQFLRGMDGGAGVDPDRASRTALKLGGNTGDNVGSSQADHVRSHKHPTKRDGCGTTCGNRFYLVGPGDPADTDSETGTFGGTETRPINIYINPKTSV